MKSARICAALITALMFTLLSRAQTMPATQPGVINASDKAAIDAALGQDVAIEGVVSAAEWSRSGKVMNIDFKDATESRLLAVLFEKKKENFNQAFGGDVGKALVGAKVRLKGKLEPYGGKSESMVGRPQLILNDPHQITILEQPTTQPG